MAGLQDYINRTSAAFKQSATTQTVPAYKGTADAGLEDSLIEEEEEEVEEEEEEHLEGYLAREKARMALMYGGNSCGC